MKTRRSGAGDRCIVTIINDEYADPALVFLFSLKRQSMLDGVDLAVLCAGEGYGALSEANRTRICSIAPAEFVSVRNLDLYREYLTRSPWSESRFLPAYFSLEIFLNERFEEYETICYLDADMLCLREFQDVFHTYDRSGINGSRTCQEYFGYPNVMRDFYINSGFLIFNRSLLPEFRSRVRAVTLDQVSEYCYGYWDQLVINNCLRPYIRLPFTDCNFKPLRENMARHRVIHYSGPDWKPWKVRSPDERFRYLFEPWWNLESEVKELMNNVADPDASVGYRTGSV